MVVAELLSIVVETGVFSVEVDVDDNIVIAEDLLASEAGVEEDSEEKYCEEAIISEEEVSVVDADDSEEEEEKEEDSNETPVVGTAGLVLALTVEDGVSVSGQKVVYSVDTPWLVTVMIVTPVSIAEVEQTLSEQWVVVKVVVLSLVVYTVELISNVLFSKEVEEIIPLDCAVVGSAGVDVF